jgi:NAD-dependent SIR2 family protein deacetylase
LKRLIADRHAGFAKMTHAMTASVDGKLERAARAIAGADALLIAAGAGMGVDSGLPDFRGTEGFWRAYPPLAKLGLPFEQMANPAWFDRDPQLAWGFYGHRLNLYRATTPHAGFQILRRWAGAKPGGYFVFTSNVDGHFQSAGFDADRVVECHGSLLHLQCTRPCRPDVWPAGEVRVDVDESTMRAAGDLPRCPACGAVARPNVLMFGDGRWEDGRTSAQSVRYQSWLRSTRGARLAVIECGAGTGVPTVRLESERVAARFGATLVRVNVRDPHVPPGDHIGVPLGALEALAALDRLGM